MSDRPGAEVAQADLHALVDDQLPPARRRAVEDWLEANPQMAATVAGWQAQNRAIRGLFAGEAEGDEAADRKLIRALRSRLARPARWLPVAIAALFLAIGLGTGVLATRALQAPRAARETPSLPEAARASFVVLAAEAPDTRPDLLARLGGRLGTSLAAPDLSGLGFRLAGGRLVPVGDAPGALLVFEDAAGARLTWLVIRDPAGTPDTGFRFAERGGVGTFYWLDGGLGYALSGSLPRDRLLQAATAIYGQL